MHTNEELREMAGHVVYEIEEFRESIAEFDRLTRLREIDGAWNRHSWNRSLESVLLHFRVLRGFFIDPPKKADASARDYVAAWLPVEDPIFSKTKTALDQKLAHLTWNRVPWSPGNWDTVAMNAAIDKLFEEFKKSLTAPAADWFAPTPLTITRGLSDSDGNSTVSVSWSKPMF
jgi:hypothetical protein